MNRERLLEITNLFKNKSVLVIGDLMLDQYFWGNAERISPEAPVPIVQIEKINNMPGGAGNVAVNLAHLKCKTYVAGLIGNDEQGRSLISRMEEEGINTDGIVVNSRTTTVKTRIIAKSQQILRTDMEDLSDIDSGLMEAIFDGIQKLIPEIDGLIIADYNKGLLTTDLIRNILDEASISNIPVYVDPKSDNFYSYQNVRLFKPNKNEFLNATGISDSDENEFEQSGYQLAKDINSELLLVTRGERGATLFFDEVSLTIPTRARKVHDVSGAGDTVISVFTLADLCGATPEESTQIANLAAGSVVAEVGAVPINFDKLMDMYDDS